MPTVTPDWSALASENERVVHQLPASAETLSAQMLSGRARHPAPRQQHGSRYAHAAGRPGAGAVAANAAQR
jgi:hypothetical protein